MLAEVNYIVAIVGKDGLDQVLANIVHVTIDGCNHDHSLADTFNLFEIVLKVVDRLLHYFGRLQHEGQNQFASTEFVADFFHRGEQGVVENFYSDFMSSG